MPGPSNQEKGVRQTVAHLRSEFRGVVKQYDPGALVPGDLQEAYNVRIVDGNIVNRGGQSVAFGQDDGDAMSGSPIGIFDDWEGSLAEWPTYGSFLYLTGAWEATTVEPPYRQAFVDLVGGVVTPTYIARDGSLLGSDFAPGPSPPILVGDYYYQVYPMLGTSTYGGGNFSQQFLIARAPKDGSAGFTQFDLYLESRLSNIGGTAFWGAALGFCHDGTDFYHSFGGADSSAPRIVTSNYQCNVLKLTNCGDGVTVPSAVGDVIVDMNAQITAGGGVAMVTGANTPQFWLAHCNGYLLLYPTNGVYGTIFNGVGGTRPGYAGYCQVGNGFWNLVNASASPLASGGLGRCRPGVEHSDGKFYIQANEGDNTTGTQTVWVWDPATDPAVITRAFSLTGNKRWLSDNGANVGGRMISWRGKLYFTWRDAVAGTVGLGSWDGSTLEEEVWSDVYPTGTTTQIHLAPLRTGLAVMVTRTPGATVCLVMWYSTDATLTSWLYDDTTVDQIPQPHATHLIPVLL